MLPSLQSSRPKLPTYPPVTGQYHQQRTQHQSHGANPTQAPSYSAVSGSTTKPQSQIEAMPPFAPNPSIAQVPPPSAAPTQPGLFSPATLAATHQPQFNSAIRHPVFFTDKLRRPPFPLPEQAGAGVHPVAIGYVFEPGAGKTKGGMNTKL